MNGRGQLKCDGTRAETRLLLSAKRTSPFKSAGVGGSSVPSTTGSRGVRTSGSNAGYNIFRGSVKGTGYPLHSPVSPSLPFPCVTVCHHISAGVHNNGSFWGSCSVENIELPEPFLTTHIHRYVSVCLHGIFINKNICCIINETPFTL